MSKPNITAHEVKAERGWNEHNHKVKLANNRFLFLCEGIMSKRNEEIALYPDADTKSIRLLRASNVFICCGIFAM
jgi:hypothetical protein